MKIIVFNRIKSLQNTIAAHETCLRDQGVPGKAKAIKSYVLMQ